MRKTIRKTFWLWNFDKEEKWLNEMAAKGLGLVAVEFGKYTFEECSPGSYHVRLELLENLPSHAESQQYIKFLEETGAEYLGSIFRWVYFRKKTGNGEFNLYSDRECRIQQLNRIISLMGILWGVSIFNGFNNMWLYFRSEVGISLFLGVLCLSLSAWFTYGLTKLMLKKKQMKKERNLFE